MKRNYKYVLRVYEPYSLNKFIFRNATEYKQKDLLDFIKKTDLNKLIKSQNKENFDLNKLSIVLIKNDVFEELNEKSKNDISNNALSDDKDINEILKNDVIYVKVEDVLMTSIETLENYFSLYERKFKREIKREFILFSKINDV